MGKVAVVYGCHKCLMDALDIDACSVQVSWLSRNGIMDDALMVDAAVQKKAVAVGIGSSGEPETELECCDSSSKRPRYSHIELGI
ncbi:hypothetical protein RHMOL_Rhmol05G0006100 [Rhododendron molle]|uniref:Uncharacterized protein n=1 Tax=Rhododendron molle TaxID=49168 RepID=A0ACC0NK07_RHOML|nr:hypothetical protein RHMOL_Rhmol05G0006100 [Rhododendron molle]